MFDLSQNSDSERGATTVMEDPTLIYTLITPAIMLLAGFVHGALGLGFPLVATPLLALLMDVRSAILVTLIPTVSVNVASILRGGNWGESLGRYWYLAVFVALGSILGSLLLISVDPAPFKLVLALMIVLYLTQQRVAAALNRWVTTRPRLAAGLLGLAAGLMAGTVNVMVPVLIILFMGLTLSKTAMVQIFNWCFLSGKSLQIVVFAAAGLLNMAVLRDSLPNALLALVGLVLGMRLGRALNAAHYRYVLRWVLAVLAGLLLMQSALLYAK